MIKPSTSTLPLYPHRSSVRESLPYASAIRFDGARMRLRRPLIFILYCLFKHSASFKIGGIPTEVTPNQEVTFEWTYDPTDPPKFALAAVIPTLSSPERVIVITERVSKLEQKGIETFTVPDIKGRTLIVAAFDLGALSPTDIVNFGKNQLPDSFYTYSPSIAIVSTAGSSPSITVQSASPATTRNNTGSTQPSLTTDTMTDQTATRSTQPSSTTATMTDPTAKPNIAMIIGAVLGALALVVLIVYAIFCYRRRRKNNRGPSWKPAGRLTTGSELGCWRRQRDVNHTEGSYQRDENVRAVSPYPLAGTVPETTKEEHPINIPLSVARQQVENPRGEAPDHQPVGQSGMDVYLSLDIMRRELYELRRMVQDSQGVEESLPDYSSQ
ncbi:hypothetical protein PQX77_020546 [Marasmius sp. AFHP31]|nr:hypothetical protein PQX77_020546 [Marasmius sp. AFHP31]